MAKKIIIWDLDGTLLDTLDDLYLATNHALLAFDMPPRTKDEVRMFVGNGVRRLIEQAVPNGDANPRFEDIFAEFKRYYVLHCQDNTRLYPGIADTLRTLKSAGVRMALVSNKLQEGVDELYQALFRDTIEVAIGEQSGVARKPQPDMVYKALEMMHVTPAEAAETAVYVGDSEVDIATARNAGIPCISVLWGFRDRDFLLQHGATTFALTPTSFFQDDWWIFQK